MISTPQSASEVFTNLDGLNEIRQEKNDPEALRKVSQQFESMFVNMMMKSMRNANAAFEQDSLFQSNETQFYRDMYDQQLALSLSHGKGLGIAQTLYQQMSRQYGYAVDSGSASKEQNVSYSLANTQAIKSYNIDPHRMGKALSENYRTGVSSAPEQKNDSRDYSNISDKNDNDVYPVSKQNFSAQSPESFVTSLLPFAQAYSAKIGVDPHILIAQSALETGWGQSVIQDSQGQSSNNLFNIKSGRQWQGDSVLVETKEYIDGKAETQQASFRMYASIRQSFEDFAEFITDNPRYQKAVAVAENAYEFTKELQRAGYATDPNYADKINSIYGRIKTVLNSSVNNGVQP